MQQAESLLEQSFDRERGWQGITLGNVKREYRGGTTAPTERPNQTEKEEPQPQVVAALGLLTTKREPIRPCS